MRTILNITGYAAIVIGLAGLFNPEYLGDHFGAAHNLLHLGFGALTVYFAGWASTDNVSSFAITLGIAYLLAGSVGLAFGSPGSPLELGPSDPRLLRLIPGWIELGTADHVYHAVAGVFCITAGWRAGPRPRHGIKTAAEKREPVLR
ncbi:MAG: hypothetical protein HY549_07440 [Elusimicrobia bacterium]|nr:hypothetical protein [Elusimicrobiota bacterium]